MMKNFKTSFGVVGLAILLCALSSGGSNSRAQVRSKQAPTPAPTPTTSPRSRVVDGYASEFYAGRRVVGTCNTVKICLALKVACVKLENHTFKSGPDGRGACVEQANNSEGSAELESNADAQSAESGGELEPDNGSGPSDKRANAGQPDLMVKEFQFPPTDEKALRVQIVNQGNVASKACRLILTIRKINGTPAGRQTHVNIPLLAPGKTIWLVVDAKSILPVSVSLEATTFKLNADATEIVAESDETNNEVWHNQ
jgi:CARDB protein